MRLIPSISPVPRLLAGVVLTLDMRWLQGIFFFGCPDCGTQTGRGTRTTGRARNADHDLCLPRRLPIRRAQRRRIQRRARVGRVHNCEKLPQSTMSDAQHRVILRERTLGESGMRRCRPRLCDETSRCSLEGIYGMTQSSGRGVSSRSDAEHATTKPSRLLCVTS